LVFLWLEDQANAVVHVLSPLSEAIMAGDGDIWDSEDETTRAAS